MLSGTRTSLSIDYLRSTLCADHGPNDLVWVHGYELSLLPSFLFRKLRDANIGYFMHHPFPSTEIFRSLSVREHLVRGMLGANQIGFHIYEHARHFITCCRRLLGLEYRHCAGGYIAIDYQGRDVIITVGHASIEPEVIKKRMETESCKSAIRLLNSAPLSVGVE